MWLTETHNDEWFQDLNLSVLNLDEYYINFNVDNNQNLYLYSRYLDCYKCPYSLKKQLQNKYYRFKSKPAEEWKIFNKRLQDLVDDSVESNIVCSTTPDVGEFGVYALDVSDCSITTEKEPVNIYAGFLTVILLTCLFISLGYTLLFLYQKINRDRKEVNASNNDEITEKTPKKGRIQSLDTFRGISIVLMIFVNYGGGGYEFFEHATWNGLTIADCVFPWFMWIMGVCIPISIKSAIKGDTHKGLVFLNILRRSFILFLLGMYLGSGAKLDSMRIFGVLQRFGLCYLAVASLLLIFSNLNLEVPENKYAQWFLDIFVIFPQWIVILIIMSIHLILTFQLEVPDCPTGYLGPGGIHDGGQYFNCTGGATRYIDTQVLGEKHLYQYPTASYIYGSVSFDPEGFFGTFMSLVQVFIGVQAGSTLLVYKEHKSRLIRWISWGLVCGLLGGILCNFSQEEGVIPVNKNLWSLSFVLVTSCFAFLLLSACYVIIDIYNVWSGKPFIFAGMNATIMYVGHSLSYGRFPFQWMLTPMNTHYLLLAEAVWGTSLWILVAFWLFNIKFFLSL